MRRASGLVACLGLLVAACGGGDAVEQNPVDEQSIVISNWEGYMPEDLPDTFAAATGFDATVSFHATNEEIVGKLVAAGGEGFDVAFVSGQFAQALNEQGLLAEIDPDKVPNLKNLYPEATELGYDPGNTFSVPYAWGTTGLCYRSDLLSEAPDSWMDLLRPSDEAAGKVTMLATERWLMLPAQKALGFSVNTTDEGEMTQVKDLLIEAKQNLLAYDDTTFYSKLVSGEAVLVEAWDGWCNYGILEDPNIKYVIPSEGTDLWVDTMVILGSSANKDAAHAFLNYVLDEDNHAWVVENILYKVPNQAAMDKVDPSLAETFPNLGMTPAEVLGGEALLDLGEAQPMYTDIATEVAAGG
ncbi:MAG: spermidine/putrescine ABC transporter substrate-binding protein [Acidimicrobiia bacterium]|nr:spermidine/putrescine ABC transporter substrate-binding protein [Acidimicrobiia bacterium]MDH4307152.1 spermidine/putrescine ABC transporter substrate-binding protein [Acidimicrobiia bacterium]MDH5292306.1 spermidine/putrescine ABC transporter substrate-binding protein [Acidimicrobiia bacterium]